MTQMSFNELEKKIQVAKTRSDVYMLLSQNGFDVTPTKSLNTWIRNSLNDKEYVLNRVLRAARTRIEQIENIT
jgi:hypothetical protein